MNAATPSILFSLSRTVLVSLLLVAALACGGGDSAQITQIAGTYAMTSHDGMARRLLEGSTMTLNPDGTWHSAVRLDPSFGIPWARETGTWIYRPESPTLGMRSSEGRVVNLLVRGDTLSSIVDERQIALAEAVTNVKVTGGVETFYVRVH